MSSVYTPFGRTHLSLVLQVQTIYCMRNTRPPGGQVYHTHAHTEERADVVTNGSTELPNSLIVEDLKRLIHDLEPHAMQIQTDVTVCCIKLEISGRRQLAFILVITKII